MDGVIEGADIFVWLAYSAAWGGMILYGLSLWMRYRAVEHEYDVFIQKIGSVRLDSTGTVKAASAGLRSEVAEKKE